MGVLIKTQDQIQRTILDGLEASGVVTDQSPGKVGYIISQLVARELADVYRSTDLNTRLSYLANSQGALLDLHGAVYGITRRPSQVASSSAESKNVKFYVNSGTLASKIPTKIIPANTEITTDDSSPTYRTIANTPFNDVVSEVFVSVVSTSTGEEQNVDKNELTTHNLGISDVLVTNLAATGNGSEPETDAQFKARISDALLTGVTSNTASLLEAAGIVSGVSETRIEPFANGPGTVRITVIPTANAVSEDIRSQAVANLEIVRGAGTRVDVRGPRFVPVEIVVLLHFTVQVPEGEKKSVREQAVQAILGYLNVLRLGQPFVVNELIQRIMDIHEGILDLEIRCFSFRRRPQVLKNFIPEFDELLIPDPLSEEPIKVL